MGVVFALYAGLIPVVPLVGMNIFHARNEKKKKKLCMWLFFGQLVISAAAVLAYFKVI